MLALRCVEVKGSGVRGEADPRGHATHAPLGSCPFEDHLDKLS